MSIFPRSNVEISNKIEAKVKNSGEKILKEYAWDFEEEEFLLKDGKFSVIVGKDALKIWIWRALNTERFKYNIYSAEYGNNLQAFTGKGFSKGFIESEAKRMVWECLKVNKNIKAIENFSVKLRKDKLELNFLLKTSEGVVNINNIVV